VGVQVRKKGKKGERGEGRREGGKDVFALV